MCQSWQGEESSMEEIQTQGWEPAEEYSGEVQAGWVAQDEKDHYDVLWWTSGGIGRNRQANII